MIESGSADHPGAAWDGEGVNFALYSAHAEEVVLCLFDADDRETARLRLPGHDGDVWHGYVPGLEPGQRYGYRVRGRYEPEKGLRFNHNKLLLDPYARELSGTFVWRPEVFGYRKDPRDRVMSTSDSAPFVPKAVVRAGVKPATGRRRIPWAETILYEANVRGFTMRHPDVPELDRGTFRGMRHGRVIEYLKALGVTSIELLPVHAFIDEHFLSERGLRNFWGYNTLCFFAPAPRLLGGGGVAEFVEMVDALHDANLEVVLDVVYNHTAEGSERGPTVSFRGIDNPTYYRLHPERRAEYINDTGCGNTIEVDNERVRLLILDSLRYWARDLGVDGFRFDLASILGRSLHGFDSSHTLLVEVAAQAKRHGYKIIAEPWDVGPGGYQLGAFGPPWREWNDRFRDTVRRFWRGDAELAPEFARRVHGSADLFEPSGRGPSASINFVASHDGFTTADLVSYERRHNEDNGEHNRDGHGENFSANYGIEGPTHDDDILRLRRRQRLNLLATVLLSHGTPMLLAGDEFGNTQRGNNNAYAQDNETGWLDWSCIDRDPEFVAQVAGLIRLRKHVPLLRQDAYSHGAINERLGHPDIEWFDENGEPMREEQWANASTLGLLLVDRNVDRMPREEPIAVALLFHAGAGTQRFVLPPLDVAGRWRAEFCSASPQPAVGDDRGLELEGPCLACATYRGGGPLSRLSESVRALLGTPRRP